MKVETIVENFVKQSVLHGRGTTSGNSEQTNAAHDEIVAALKELHRVDPELKMLAPLLAHEDISVRTWAATYLLPRNTEVALAVLRDASCEEGFLAFNAAMVLREWEAGRLRLLV